MSTKKNTTKAKATTPVTPDVTGVVASELTLDIERSDNTPLVDDTNELETVLLDINTSIVATSGNTEAPSVATVVPATTTTRMPTDRITVQSIYHGRLIYNSPINGSRWAWDKYGATQSIPLSELEHMSNSKPEILRRPMVVIKDTDIISYFNLGDVYRKVSSFAKLGAILETNNVEHIRKAVRELVEVGMRETVIAEVRRRRESNTLVNINVINMLNAELKCNLE